MAAAFGTALWAALSGTAAIASAPLAMLRRDVGTSGMSAPGVALQQPFLSNKDAIPLTATWGSRTVSNFNVYDTANIPDTGTTRYYDFHIDRGVIAPDGVNRSVILINGEFPGPAIEANWGDWIEVQVHNGLQNEGTSMHWHGLLQKETPWMDGVPSLSQCPIAPGASLTYRFRAEMYGSTWYHAHYSAQYNAGLFGPLVINGPSSQDYDLDLGPVMLFDWYHRTYYELVTQAVGTALEKLPVTSVNNLINGKNQFPCNTLSAADQAACNPQAGQSKFHFQTGKVHRLRLMNTGSDGVQKFRIDQHKMTIIQQDFVATQPIEVDTVTLGVGQRTDVLVKAHLPPGSAVWMRSSTSPGQQCGGSQHGDATAMIYYDGADETQPPRSTDDGRDISRCWNDPVDTIVPIYPIQPQEPDVVHALNIAQGPNATGHIVWTLNDQTYRANYNHPIVQLASAKDTSYPFDPEWNVYNYQNAKSVRFVITNPTPSVHPWHIHGHDAYILAEGALPWNGQIPRPNSPLRRDTHIVRPGGYLVMQIDNDNPGVWPFHCHIAWHLSEGLSMSLMMQPDNLPDVKSWMSQTCDAWDAFSNRFTVTEIDAGA